MSDNFWNNRRVFITGHTGFKGSWLSIWLHSLGAKVAGYSIDIPTTPSLFQIAHLSDLVNDNRGDIRNLDQLFSSMNSFKPDVVFHLAAQPLVCESYLEPLHTLSTNVMGTANVLEAVRKIETVKSVVIVTTDKCYENKEWYWGYRENEPLGGYDPYSGSKAAAEIITSSYRQSYFNPNEYGISHKTAIATARAGNVIGGGDWAKDRLIPDILRAFKNGKEVSIRNPHSIRPWQHVLESLSGYLMLAEKMYFDGVSFSEAWNFGPFENDNKDVSYIVKNMCELWGGQTRYNIEPISQVHEAKYLKLDISKALMKLGWLPSWNLDMALLKIIEWVKAVDNGENVFTVCVNQIQEYWNK